MKLDKKLTSVTDEYIEYEESKQILRRHRRYFEEDERNTKKKKNTKKEKNTEKERNSKEKRNTEQKRKTEKKKYTGKEKNTIEKRKNNNSKEGRQRLGADFQEIRRLDDKVKCNVCGVVSQNSNLYEEHLGSKMHKAFSMVIDLT